MAFPNSLFRRKHQILENNNARISPEGEAMLIITGIAGRSELSLKPVKYWYVSKGFGFLGPLRNYPLTKIMFICFKLER